MPNGGHITLAWGRDYSEVTPVKSLALGGGEQIISVSVDVSRKNCRMTAIRNDPLRYIVSL